METALARPLSHGDVSEIARAMSKNRTVVSRQLNPEDAMDNPLYGCALLLYGLKRKRPDVLPLAWSLVEGYYARLQGREVGEQTVDELVREIGECAARAVAKARELPADERLVLVSRIYGAVTAALGGAHESRPAEAG